MSNRWWAVHTRPQRETDADRDLRRLGIETFYPHVSEWVGLKTNRSRLVKRPWLSRYLFVHCSRELLHKVNSAIGVATVVYAAGSEPFPIPNAIMQLLFDQADSVGEVYQSGLPKNKFLGRAGQKFRFGESSPLFGFVAEIVSVLDNNNIIAQFQDQFFGASGRTMSVPFADVGELLEQDAKTLGVALHEGQTAVAS